jgi:hypothetical protein
MTYLEPNLEHPFNMCMGSAWVRTDVAALSEIGHCCHIATNAFLTWFLQSEKDGHVTKISIQ